MTESAGNDLATPFHRVNLKFRIAWGAERVHSYAPRFIRDHMPQEHQDFFGQLPS